MTEGKNLKEERERGTTGYIVGTLERFNQKNELFKRARWDPSLKKQADRFFSTIYPRNKSGYSHKDLALREAAWYIEDAFAHGCRIHNTGLFSWENELADLSCIPKDIKLDITHVEKTAEDIKNAARLFGASLVGITKLNENWLYSHTYNTLTNEVKELDFPADCNYAIVLAFEMDYELVKTSPAWLSQSTEGIEYSRMPVTTSMLAQFIRGLGYKAIPGGNDTAINIPLAIDAGLGELGRNGLLITRRFGPRVRLARVFTDLPLKVDKPIDLGITRFCEICDKCAVYCPGQAIMYGKKTTKGHNISTSTGTLKWPVNAEECFSFWARNQGSCMNCIRVCPLNKSPHFIHNVSRWFVKNFPVFDSSLVKIDNLLGYGKQKKAHFWND
jgi:reductive dehalogenase